MAIWQNSNGNIIQDSNGQIIECDECPCESTAGYYCLSLARAYFDIDEWCPLSTQIKKYCPNGEHHEWSVASPQCGDAEQIKENGYVTITDTDLYIAKTNGTNKSNEYIYSRDMGHAIGPLYLQWKLTYKGSTPLENCDSCPSFDGDASLPGCYQIACPQSETTWCCSIGRAIIENWAEVVSGRTIIHRCYNPDYETSSGTSGTMCAQTLTGTISDIRSRSAYMSLSASDFIEGQVNITEWRETWGGGSPMILLRCQAKIQQINTSSTCQNYVPNRYDSGIIQSDIIEGYC